MKFISSQSTNFIKRKREFLGSHFTNIYKKHNSKIFTAIPLSTKIKDDNPFYQKFTFRGKEQSAIIFQLRTLDSKRLVNKIGELSEMQFKKIKDKFLDIYS